MQAEVTRKRRKLPAIPDLAETLRSAASDTDIKERFARVSARLAEIRRESGRLEGALPSDLARERAELRAEARTLQLTLEGRHGDRRATWAERFVAVAVAYLDADVLEGIVAVLAEEDEEREAGEKAKKE